MRLRWQFKHWNREKLEKFQKKRLEDLLEHIQRNSKFYSRLIESGTSSSKIFHSLPVIEKSDFMDNFNAIITVGLDRDQLINFAIEQEKQGRTGLYNKEFSIGLSSGTSGNTTLTVLNSRERALYGAAIAARNGISGLFSRKILFALRKFNPAYASVERFGIKLYFVDYTITIQECIDKINKLQVNIIAGPPSLLILLSKKVDEIKSDIKFIVSYGEVLSTTDAKTISEEFDAPIRQIYQGAEGLIASSCKFGSLHINEDLVYCEYEIPDEYNPNIVNVIITDLHRRTLPFVRYRINDIIELSEKRCRCGSSFQVIKQIHGRKDDIFKLEGVELPEVLLFPDYIRRSINQVSPIIQEYQAIQHNHKEIEIRLIIPDASDDDIKRIQDCITDNLHRYMDKIGAKYPKIDFTDRRPEKNPRSLKLIRVLSKL